MSPEVIVEAAGPLGDAPSRPIKAFYNLCGYDPSEESPILLSWIGDFFLSGGLPKMATCSESKQFTVCSLIRGADNPTTFFVTQEDPVQVALVQLQNSAKIRGSAAFVLIDLVQYPGFCDTAA